MFGFFSKKHAIRLVSMKDMLNKANHEKYAVAQININNLEWIKAVLETVKETNSPVILGVSEGAAKYMCGFRNVVDMVNDLINFYDIKQPVALHLDHGSYDAVKAAIKAGFSSVMFDGSSLPINENLEKTAKIAKLCRKHKISLEAEVGGIGGVEDGHVSSGELANVEECKTISQLDITCLAAGIGNIHGVYPKNWKGLNFKLLEQIKEVTNKKPMVLHGGTGIDSKQIKNAIALGVSKINVNTECQLAFAAGIRKYIQDKKDLDVKKKGFDPRKLLKPGVENIKRTIKDKFEMFGSINKA